MRDLFKNNILEVLVLVAIVVLTALGLIFNNYKFIIAMLSIVILYLTQKNSKLNDELFALHYEVIELRFQLTHVLNKCMDLQELIKNMTEKEELDDYNQYTS